MGGKIFHQFTEPFLQCTHFPHIKLVLKHNLEYVYCLCELWQLAGQYLISAKHFLLLREPCKYYSPVSWGKRKYACVSPMGK